MGDRRESKVVDCNRSHLSVFSLGKRRRNGADGPVADADRQRDLNALRQVDDVDTTGTCGLLRVVEVLLVKRLD